MKNLAAISSKRRRAVEPRPLGPVKAKVIKRPPPDSKDTRRLLHEPELHQSMLGEGPDHLNHCRTAVTNISVWQRALDDLRKANEELELRVRQRTAELWRTHQALKAERVHRKRAERVHLHVLRRLVEAQESERGRLARELHDGFGQELTVLSLGLKRLGDDLPRQAPFRTRLTQLSNIVGGMMSEVHSLVWNLRPPALDDLGLVAVLRRYTEQWTKLAGVPVGFHSRGFGKRRLPLQVETTLYRIAQEALTNVFKHARARRVSVLLEHGRNQGALIVEDDGRGFQIEKVLKGVVSAQGHAGLMNMRERATMTGGTINFETAPGSGTTVSVRIPFAPEPGKEGTGE